MGAEANANNDAFCVDLMLDECLMLKARVAAIYDSPLIVGCIGDVLEGREAEVPAADEQTLAVRTGCCGRCFPGRSARMSGASIACRRSAGA